MRPVRMTKKMVKDLTQEFHSKLLSMDNIVDTKFSFDKSFDVVEKDAVEVNFTTEAYEEMSALINHFSSEVAWHGLVKRIDETHFQITKILVYPQKVTGVTVNTDYAKYQPWLYERSDEEFNAIRFQGHSHVNMAVSPSGVDLTNQWDLINNLSSDDFYIFMIWNKRFEYNVRVVDMAKNVIYNGADVKVTIGDFDSVSFLKEADEMVEKPVYKTYYGTGGTIYAGSTFVGNSAAAAKETPKAPALKTVTGSAAPKVVDNKGSNLLGYYKQNPDKLVEDWNSSCLPYIDALP